MAILSERTTIYSEAKDHDYYRAVGKVGNTDALEVPFAAMGDAFVVFACIGFHYERYIPLEDRDEMTLSVYLDQDLQVPILAALAFARLRSEMPDAPIEELATKLESTRTIIPIVQGWANGGVQIFREATETTTSSPLLTMGLFDLIAAAHPELLTE